MRRQCVFLAMALALAGLAGGCAHARSEAPVSHCIVSRTNAAGTFYGSENGAGWSQFRGALDSPFADPPYITMHYTLSFRGNGEARVFHGIENPSLSVSFGHRFRERELPLHRGGVRQRFRAEARVTDEAISVGAARDGWAFFPQTKTPDLLRNTGDLELALYDSHGRLLHREFVSQQARDEIERTLLALARQALEKAQDPEANCRLTAPEDEIVVD